MQQKEAQTPRFCASCSFKSLKFLPIHSFCPPSGSSTSTQTTVWNQAKAGEPFTVYALLRNTGSDGITTVQAKANSEVMAEKIMTVPGGSWRVVQMDITLDAGEYTIEIGGQTGTIIIE